MNIDRKKLTRKDIISKPGQLSARIIYNNLIKTKFAVSIISDQTGYSFYNIQVENIRATVAYTSRSIAIANCNRDHLRKELYQNFRDNIYIIDTNLLHLTNMVNPINAGYIGTVIINPSFSNSFFPISLKVISELISSQKIEYDPEIHSDYEVISLQYNKDIKRYVVKEDKEDSWGEIDS